MKIEINWGTGVWEDITHAIEKGSLSLRTDLHRNMKPTTNSASFSIADEPAVMARFIAVNVDCTCRITTDDGVQLFYGFYKRDIDTGIATGLMPGKVEFVDSSYLLKKKVSETINLSGTTVGEVTIRLLQSAGISRIAIPPIPNTIDYAIVTEADDETYAHAIEALLSEYGYVLYFDESDTARVFNLVLEHIPDPERVFSTGSDGNVYGQLKVKANATQYDGCKVKYYTHERKIAATVFSDTTGASADYTGYGVSQASCDIPLADHQGVYPPRESMDQKVYSEYSYDRGDIVTVLGAILDWYADGDVRCEAFTNYFRRADVKFTGSGRLKRFVIKGEAIVQAGINIVKSLIDEVTTENLEEIECRYITTHEDATRLAVSHRKYWEYSDKEYSWKTKEQVYVGDIVRLKEPTRLGLDFPVRIFRIDYNDDEDFITVHAEGIIEFAAAPVLSDSTYPTIPVSQITETILDGLRNRPTYEELVAGYDRTVPSGSATTVPTTPILSAKGSFKAVILEWDRQHNLTNLSRYELQVRDGTTWYSLGTTDWKGEEGGLTSVQVEMYVHADIPLILTEEHGEQIPNGRTLYYRVRRITKKNIASAWSDVVSATASPVPDGSLSAGCVHANSIKAGALAAYLARFTSVEITDEGFVGTSSDGSKRVRLSENSIAFEIKYNGQWRMEYQIGGQFPGRHTGNAHFTDAVVVGTALPEEGLVGYFTMEDGAPVGVLESGTIIQDDDGDFSEYSRDRVIYEDGKVRLL